MTGKESLELIGKRARYQISNGLIFDVEIVDTRKVFDRDEVQIEPVSGSGSAWVNFNSVTIKLTWLRPKQGG